MTKSKSSNSNYNSFVRSIVILLLAVGVVTTVSVLRFSGAAEEEEKKKSYAELDAQEMIEHFHETVNDYFNVRIKKLVALSKNKEKGDLEKLSLLLAPPTFNIDPATKQPSSRTPCAGEGDQINLSTYCLSQIAVNEYFDFRAGMLVAREKAKVDSALQGRDLSDVYKNVQSYAATVETIDREIALARETLDQALATYNEFQLALPLHTKYLQVITALESYRDKVAKVRKEIDQYPPTFLDVTTTACT